MNFDEWLWVLKIMGIAAVVAFAFLILQQIGGSQ